MYASPSVFVSLRIFLGRNVPSDFFPFEILTHYMRTSDDENWHTAPLAWPYWTGQPQDTASTSEHLRRPSSPSFYSIMQQYGRTTKFDKCASTVHRSWLKRSTLSLPLQTPHKQDSTTVITLPSHSQTDIHQCIAGVGLTAFDLIGCL